MTIGLATKGMIKQPTDLSYPTLTAIKDAVWNASQADHVAPGTMGFAQVYTFYINYNKYTIDTANEVLQLWNSAGDAVIKEWDLTDKDGTPIILQGTGPANRGVPGDP